MKRFKRYSALFESLTEEQKQSFFSLQSVIFPITQNRFVNLLEQSNIRASSHLQRFKDYGKFFDEEIIRATNDLTAIGVDCDWSDVDFHLNEIKREIKAGKLPKNYGLYAENDIFERELRILLLNLLSSSGMLSEYLQTVSGNSDVKHIRDLRDIDKVIEIITRFRMLVFLTARTESEPPPDKIKKGSSKPSIYSELWRDPEKGRRVKEIFDSTGITNKGVYNADPTRCKNTATELLKAFDILEPIMKYRARIHAVKCFYHEFQAPVNISDRTLSGKPDNLQSVDHKRFTKMFAPLLR